ncbi:hypothetical protein [Amycolatopsis albispora]|uniref:Four helix bundle protein n=1 Tax=Amycolatopsis albispora TaxID=1804986 RepID=A0A344L3F7_9PSEU|nr:hypothetical protein [Amycolatopsis albispora]AXB42581.1 hypothetical protein A4R43_08600 [Amycolatopsis albispora]
MNTSMEDAGRCLLSVAWNMRSSPTRDCPRAEAIRDHLRVVCRSTGHAACAWARSHGPGSAEEYLPFLRLADLAYEIDTLLLLVSNRLVPDDERDLRRWKEIEKLVARAELLAMRTAGFLRDAQPVTA